MIFRVLLSAAMLLTCATARTGEVAFEFDEKDVFPETSFIAEKVENSEIREEFLRDAFPLTKELFAQWRMLLADFGYTR